MMPFENIMGNMIYLVLFGVYGLGAWVRQKSALIPVVIGFSIGGLFLGFMPAAFREPVIALLILGAMGIIYALYKER
jgi:hypothetical protein